MHYVYFINGELADQVGVGITLATFVQDEHKQWLGVLRMTDGQPYFGHQAQEVDEQEFWRWKERIANPDMKDYFPGIFPGYGVVNKETYVRIQSDRAKAHQSELQRQADALTPAYEYAAKLALATGDEPSAVFDLLKPGVSKELKELLLS